MAKATRPARWIWVLLIANLVACKGSGSTDGPASASGPGSVAWSYYVAAQALPPSATLASAALAPTRTIASEPASGQERLFDDGAQTPSPSSPVPTDQPPATLPTFVPAKSPPVRLVIPSIQLDAPVVAIGWHQVADSGQSAWDDPGSAAGWLKNSAFPGRGSNVVLAGHHNIRGKVFRHLIDLQISDPIYLVGPESTYCYRVTERFIVPEKYASAEQKEQNALWIAPTIDERLTLITCWPYRSNSHRLIVVAKPDLSLSAESTPSIPPVSSQR